MYHGQSIVGKELFWLNLFCFNNQNEHSSRFTSVSAIRNTSFKLCACVRFDRLFSQYPAQIHNSMHERAYVLHVHDSLSCMYDWKLLNIITKRSILDVAAALYPPLMMKPQEYSCLIKLRSPCFPGPFLPQPLKYTLKYTLYKRCLSSSSL